MEQGKHRIRVDRRRLEAVMALRGIDNATLAAAIGKHYNSVVRIKTEETTAFETLSDVCNALYCHPFDLMVAEGFPEPFLAAPASL